MDTPELLKLKNLGEKLAKLDGLAAKKLTDPKLSAVSVMRVTEGAKAHIISEIPCRKVVVTSDTLAAKSITAKLKSYPNKEDKVFYLPHKDDVLLPRKGFSTGNVRERMRALYALASDKAETVVVSADALSQLVPARRLVERFGVSFAAEDVISPQNAADKLTAAGYVRQEMVGDGGEFALRGDILDVYGTDGRAFRINFFDELIENIKVIDPESMLALNDVGECAFPPISDILLDEKGYESAKEKLAFYRNNKYASEVSSVLNLGACSPSAVWAVPFAEGVSSSFIEYLDDGEPTVFIFDEPKVVHDKLTILEKEFSGRLAALKDAGEITVVHEGAGISVNEIRRQLLLTRKLSFTSIGITNPVFEPKLTIEPTTRPVTKYYLDPQSIYGDLRTFSLNGFTVILACGSAERAKSIAESLYEEGIPSAFSEDGNGEGILVTPLNIETGVTYPDKKICVIGVSECVGKHRGESVVLPKTQFTAPKAGDYVVHRVHGVGLCEGTTILKTGEFEKEYVVLKYRDGDILYVAADQTDNLQKFVGDENPPLNKLGGKEFEREKEKVKKSVRKLAVNLIELYAKREKQKGYYYESDTIWQKEFEDSFEYEETPDQLKAIEEIKKDMESGKIMDRLLVGDVGFGKTEVAFRAMFKTVLAAKQAVLLAPTTILARQHYENLIPRLEPFGIKCGLLTRLQSAAENRETISELEDGTMHMVVATHKVLMSDIKFRDLGLLVLDEEQRFGVEHKEKLKEKYPLVNVLTLSATPIPRTLNMALSGVRDISLLETAPKGRLPVQTYVAGYSDALVADAVTRETARGGQTLILLNDIQALDVFASRIRSILKDVRLVTAHGQMAAGELEKRITAFYEKEYDVLVATTIIENGIDLPNANTLIVVDSEHFGLSQLYQLRGRVGRRGTLAHAYFTIPENGVLSLTAEKRLRALLDNTEIGSGFKVALSDLSIRGAGTLLGAEQSGHIEHVGYEMYLELLGEAVDELRTGVTHKERREVEMKVDASAFIREGYVSGRDKLKIYKRIADVASVAGRDKLLAELKEIYGDADEPLVTLVNISLLKNLAASYDASRVVINKNGAGVNFYDSDVFKNEALMRAVSENSGDVMLTTSIPPSMIFNVQRLSPEKKIERLIKFFCEI